MHWAKQARGRRHFGRTSRELAAGGRQVRVAGLLVVHKSPPTAKGFHFLSPEDEDSLMDVIVRPPIYERFRTVIRVRSLLLVGGEMQREGAVSNLIAEWVAGL